MFLVTDKHYIRFLGKREKITQNICEIKSEASFYRDHLNLIYVLKLAAKNYNNYFFAPARLISFMAGNCNYTPYAVFPNQGGRPLQGRQNQILWEVNKDLLKNHFKKEKVFKLF